MKIGIQIGSLLPINTEEEPGKIIDSFEIGIKIWMTLTYKQGGTLGKIVYTLGHDNK